MEGRWVGEGFGLEKRSRGIIAETPVLESFRDERSRPATGRLLSLGRIVPTEAKPSELSGEILWAHQRGVKAKSPQL
jgi:hypothetical protein